MARGPTIGARPTRETSSDVTSRLTVGHFAVWSNARMPDMITEPLTAPAVPR